MVVPLVGGGSRNPPPSRTRELGGERVPLNGRWLTGDAFVLLPPRGRRIPTMIASKGERMLRLPARHAQAWDCAWFGLPNARYRRRVADLEAACEAEGRDAASID